MADFDRLVGAIYDCAVSPELWPEALGQIRDAVGGAYALVGFIDMGDAARGRVPFLMRRNSTWDEAWLLKLDAMLGNLPNGGGMAHDVDQPWTQLTQASEEDFQRSEFYQHWARPQGLRDTVNIPYLQRPMMTGMISVPCFATRDAYDAEDCRLMERLSPHIRRAMMINDLADKGRMALTLYQQVLDSLSVAVFVVGPGRRLVFSNRLGDAQLGAGEFLAVQSGALQVRRSGPFAALFEEAVERALNGDAALGIKGIGVPLLGLDGERAAAYILPLAGGERHARLGTGQCAVFVARRGEQQPMVAEVLRTLFDLTVAEARVSLLVAKGQNPQMISDGLDISLNTVRTHLKNSYAKTHSVDQTSLAGLVNGLLPPIAGV